jgi:uncharacterized phage-associated protein
MRKSAIILALVPMKTKVLHILWERGGSEPMAGINDVSDYIIVKTSEAGVSMNLLKLQKLLYYCEAWSQAFYDKPLTGELFQAWVHGPVNRSVYDRYKDSKVLYSDVTVSDINPSFRFESLSEKERAHVDSVLEAYGKYSGTELELMTHREAPWVRARGNCRSSERCEETIDPKFMGTYYKARLQAQ